MAESFLNSVRKSKSNQDGDLALPDAVESDEPFFSPLILPSVDRLVFLGSKWDQVKAELLSEIRTSVGNEKISFQNVLARLEQIEAEYDV